MLFRSHFFTNCTTIFIFFFFNDTATTDIYTLSLHDALPIWDYHREYKVSPGMYADFAIPDRKVAIEVHGGADRKSTRLNSSHVRISYAVFCLKKKKKNITQINKHVRTR